MRSDGQDATRKTRDLDANDISMIHSAACRADAAPALLTVLVCLIPCDANALASCRVEDIDRDAGAILVPGVRTGKVEVSVGFAAAIALELAAGGRRRGWLIEDGFGDPLPADGDTLDYARELVSAVDPEAPRGWTFASIRDAAFHDMCEHGVPFDVAVSQAGVGGNLSSSGDDARFRRRAAADWWSYRLGLVPPSAFDHARTALDAAGRRAIIERRAGGGA